MKALFSSLRLGVSAFMIFSMTGAAPAAAPATRPSPRIVGYFAEWTKYSADRIPADKLTHVNYAFAVIRDGRCAMKDAPAAKEKFAGLRKLKQSHPSLKTLISVGGWIDSGPFSDAAATEASRDTFARSCATFAHDHGFDGVDIDWEFPGGGGYEKDKFRPDDTRNFTLLLAELRRQLDARGAADHKRYELTIAAPAGANHRANIELDRIVPYLDAINLMTYDFAGYWSKRTNFNAPLYAAPSDPAGPANSADAAVKAYLAAGVPPEKLVFGVPFYGRAWTGVKDVNHGLYQPHSGQWPEAIGSGKEWAWWDIQKNYLHRGPTRYWSDAAKVPWLFDPKAGLMVSYDDPQSLRLKGEYARDKHLGGVMIWELSEDDEQSSLLSALNAGLRGR